MLINPLGSTTSTHPRKGAGLPPSSHDMEPDSTRNKANSKFRNIIFAEGEGDNDSHTGFSVFRRWIFDNFAVWGASTRHVKTDSDNSDDKEALAFEVGDEESHDHVTEC